MTDPSSPFSERATQLYDDFVRRRDAGEAVDFEALCSANADVADELRSLEAACRFVSRLLPASLNASSFSERLRRDYGAAVDPAISLDAAEHGPTPPSRALLERMRGEAPSGTRYEPTGELGRGGMGVVLSVWDGWLRRRLAMKVARDGHDRSTRELGAKTLERFLEEAQITGQLDHPGIVPVHDLGLGSDGRVYFTMRLVKGDDLGTIFECARAGTDGWNQSRALEVVLKVCDALSYAHDKGVIHRDLKPANVMVGKYGEVYVMDWGLARVLGRADGRDLRVRTDVVSTVRDDAHEDSPLVTLDGTVVGTPSFMSPEQASGRVESVGKRSDVYAVGALLYQLIGGLPPYVDRSARASSRAILARLLAGPPTPLEVLAPDAPAELIAICEKAMARDLAARYPTMQALADDLRAFVESRVVRAYETGAWAEARKWVRRNKALAAAAALFVVAAVTAGAMIQERTLRAAEVDLSRRRTTEVLALSTRYDLEKLERDAPQLWPATPDMIPRYEEWSKGARELIDGRAGDATLEVEARLSLAQHKLTLHEIRSRARKSASGSDANLEFDSSADAWWNDQLTALVADLEQFSDPSKGLMGDTLAAPFGWGIAKRLEFARSIAERSVTGPEARKLWSDAIAAIAVSPKYDGLEITPQFGLVPLGPDPTSGLWEFADLHSGVPPRRDATGRLIVSHEMSLVFVLIPECFFWMGSQKESASGRNYDPNSGSGESPPHEVWLTPYFLSKFEMTQDQWLRVTGSDPSYYKGKFSGRKDLPEPVESIDWSSCVESLARIGLTLPSEAQWEHACRAGTGSIWPTGSEIESLRGADNFSDLKAVRAGIPTHAPVNWDDGWTSHAPIDVFPPNAFGLCNMLGNVQEWCVDGLEVDFYGRSPSIDPVAPSQGRTRVIRGGCFMVGVESARSAHRGEARIDELSTGLGVRPARALKR